MDIPAEYELKRADSSDKRSINMQDIVPDADRGGVEHRWALLIYHIYLLNEKINQMEIYLLIVLYLILNLALF